MGVVSSSVYAVNGTRPQGLAGHAHQQLMASGATCSLQLGRLPHQPGCRNPPGCGDPSCPQVRTCKRWLSPAGGRARALSFFLFSAAAAFCGWTPSRHGAEPCKRHSGPSGFRAHSGPGLWLSGYRAAAAQHAPCPAGSRHARRRRRRGDQARPRGPAAAPGAGGRGWRRGSSRAPTHDPRQPEPPATQSEATRPADSSQPRPGSEDRLPAPPLGVPRAPHPAPRAPQQGPAHAPPPRSGRPLRPRPGPAPPGPTQARQAPPIPHRAGPGGGGATLGRGVASGPDARTRSRPSRLRVGPRDDHPSSPP